MLLFCPCVFIKHCLFPATGSRVALKRQVVVVLSEAVVAAAAAAASAAAGGGGGGEVVSLLGVGLGFGGFQELGFGLQRSREVFHRSSSRPKHS